MIELKSIAAAVRDVLLSPVNNSRRLARIEQKLDLLQYDSHDLRAACIDENKALLARIEQKIDLLEYYSHGARAVYIGEQKILLKVVVFGANIAFILEADDRLLSPWFIASGRYESDLSNWIVPRLQADSVCIDVGANFGYFTCVFARFAPHGRIVGVEPDPKLFGILRDNVLINGFHERTQVHNVAVGRDGAELTLYRRSIRSGNTSIIKVSDAYTASLGEAPAEPFTAQCVSVDALAQKLGGRVDFLKIDVEGAEPLVFGGAKETIRANKDLQIVFEWSPHQMSSAGFDLHEFLEELRGCDFRAFCLNESGAESEISFESLLELPYMAGVVLRRK